MEVKTMRAFRSIIARRLPSGCLLLLVLAQGACSTSPTEQLIRAEKLLNTLESKGANQYLTFQMAEIRRQIEESRKFIRTNRFEVAGETLHRVCQRLDSCGVAFMQLRTRAEASSREQLEVLTARVGSLQELVGRLPRQTYVDQNRYDIYAHRLRRYHNDLQELETLIRDQNFPEALQRAEYLERQLEMSFAGLAASNKFKIEPTRKTSEPAVQPPKRPSAAGMLATSSR
jgi:hypothetical protein